MSKPPPLSASHIGSFAYATVKDRLPIILTRVIDYLYRERLAIGSQHGEDAVEGCKEVVGRLSRLKNGMQTNKTLERVEARQPPSPHDDCEIWNLMLEEYTRINEVAPKWFTASWLYVECFMYASIHEAFYLCDALKEFDPFMDQKQKSLHDSLLATESLAVHLSTLCSGLRSLTQQRVQQYLIQFIEISLWGNRCDLSISGGAEKAQQSDILSSLETLRPNIIVNHSEMIWQHLVSLPEDQRDIVLVLDNAGFELIADLCLLTFLMEVGLCTTASIHPKTRPWFVSDTTYKDLSWTLDKLREEGGSGREMADKWQTYLSSGRWKVCENKFWTTAYDYAAMKDVDPELYAQLSKASLLIFKGDLNYRKLTGDLNWPTTTSFPEALCGFSPSPLLAIRTAKGGPVVGLAPGQEERLSSVASDWNLTGDYGQIQFCNLS